MATLRTRCYPAAPVPADTLHPGLALVAFAEAIVDGRRVLVVGSADSGVGEHLVERGARVVHVADGDPARLAEAAAANKTKHLSHGPLGDGALAVRDGAFDVALIENLAADRDPPGLLRTVRRALAPQGVAIVASPNPDTRVRLLAGSADPQRTPLDYYQLYDTVSECFDAVTMLGQTPFVGYAVAAFAPEGDVDPVLDAGLVPGGAEEPEWFIAVAAHGPADVEALTIVQLPLRNVMGPAQGAQLEAQLRSARIAERRSRERTAELEAELSVLHEKSRIAAATRADDGAQQALQQQLVKEQARSAEFETRAATADARADDAEERIAALKRDVEALEKRHAAQAKTAAMRDESAARSADDDETTRLEALLRERGAEVRRLEREAVEAERLAQQLLARLDRAQERLTEAAEGSPPEAPSEEEAEVAAAPTNGAGGEASDAAAELRELREKLDALAARNAEREADLEAARWRIAELEERIGGGSGADLVRDLDAARAEVQRQATLIDQLRSGAGSTARSLTEA